VFLGPSRPGAILRLSGCVAFLAILGGCGPELSKNDLGTVLSDLPQVAGLDKPYPMPQLGPPLPPGQGTEGDADESSP
jgi:hypothetical protein